MILYDLDMQTIPIDKLGILSLKSSDKPNELLLPNKQISEIEFLTQFSSFQHPWKIMGSDQVFINGRTGPLWQTRYFLSPFKGLAICTVRMYEDKLSGYSDAMTMEIAEESMFERRYYRLIKFFRMGCTHPFRSTRTFGMFAHEDYCPDCGMRHRYDSSG